MVSRFHTRLERIEAAPIVNLIRERREKLSSCRASLLAGGSIKLAVNMLRYIGRHESRQQVESDMTEIVLLAIAEHHANYGRWFRGMQEVEQAMACALVALAREWYGREMTAEDALREFEFSEQLEKDMRAGLSVEDSEAAQYFINIYGQYPRLKAESDWMRDYLAGVQV